MIVALGLVVAFVLVAFATLMSKTTRVCRWRADRRLDAEGQSYFRCASCGGEAFTEDGAPPKLCRKHPK